MTTTERLVIGLVLDDSLDTPDGVQQYVLTVGKWLSSQGHEVHYIVGQTVRTDLPNVHSMARNWRVRFNGNRLSIPLPASRKQLRMLLSEHDFDVIHVQVPYSPFLAGRLLKLLPSRVAVIGSFHVLPYNWSITFANRCLALLNRRTGHRFDRMLANTQPTAAFAKKVYDYNSDIVPNPFPLQAFSGQSPAPSAECMVVFLGRLVSRKGAGQLLKAIAYLKENILTNVPFKVIIGGKGPLKADFETFVRDHTLQDTVTLAGFVAEEDKQAFLAQADLAVFPSVSGESFGISLLEGMAAARGVVIAGDNPGYRSVMAPLNDEQLIRPNDTAAFAKVLAKWIDDRSAREQAASAQKDYVKQFDIEVVGHQLIKMYNEALRQRRNVR